MILSPHELPLQAISSPIPRIQIWPFVLDVEPVLAYYNFVPRDFFPPPTQRKDPGNEVGHIIVGGSTP